MFCQQKCILKCGCSSIERLGLANRSHQLAGQLSGGWKQRLALGACTLPNPQLLLLDEPTAGVDPKARREFWEELHRLAAEGLSVLVSTHYMDEAEYLCDRVAIIDAGKIIALSKPAELIDELIAGGFEKEKETEEHENQLLQRFDAHIAAKEWSHAQGTLDELGNLLPKEREFIVLEKKVHLLLGKGEKDAAAEVAAANGRRVTFEYACIADVNDQDAHADELAAGNWNRPRDSVIR